MSVLDLKRCLVESSWMVRKDSAFGRGEVCSDRNERLGRIDVELVLAQAGS